MPAIQIDRLKKQIDELSQYYDKPTNFNRTLLDLFSYYSNRIYRSGQTGKTWPLIQSYRIPSPVLHQITQAVIQKAGNNSQIIIELCDSLWLEQNLESRQLAILLLGHLSPESIDPIVERVKFWSHDIKDEVLLDTLLDEGLQFIRKKEPDLILHLAQSFLISKETTSQRTGIRILFTMLDAKRSGYENIPVIFRIITPLLLKAPIDLTFDLSQAIQKLAQNSPSETAFFLKQIMNSPTNPRTTLIIRQSINAFPPTIQESLRPAFSKNNP